MTMGVKPREQMTRIKHFLCAQYKGFILSMFFTLKNKKEVVSILLWKAHKVGLN